MVEKAHTLVKIPPQKKTKKSSSEVLVNKKNTNLLIDLEGCLNVLVQYAEIHGFQSQGFKTSDTLSHWRALCVENGLTMTKLMKYKLASFYAYHMRQKLPSSPLYVNGDDKPQFLMGGKFARWFSLQQNRLSGIEFKKFLLGFNYGFLQSKKGFPRPSKDELTKAEKDTRKELSTRPIKNELPLFEGERTVEGWINQDMAEFQIERTTRELFSKFKFRFNPDRTVFPSSSANYNNTRGELGMLGDLVAAGLLLKGPAPSIVETKEGLAFETLARRNSTYEPVYEIKQEDVNELRRRRIVLNNKVERSAEGEVPYAVFVGLLEALKVRVISKGPPFKYYFLKQLQHALWVHLQTHRNFTLIGQPVTVEYLNEILGHHLKDDYEFLSGDYANATNKLYGWCSDTSVNTLADIIKATPSQRQMMLESMTQHQLVDAEFYRGFRQVVKDWILHEGLTEFSDIGQLTATQLEDFNYFSDMLEKHAISQLTGQLMGSILSFIFLCVINAAGVRWCFELFHKRRFKIKELPFCVNGDDLLAKCHQNMKGTWSRVMDFLGLSESVGKTYFSCEFFNINSTVFSVDPENCVDKRIKYLFTQVPYVNMGLLTMQKRSVGATEAESPLEVAAQIGDIYNDLISTCPLHLRQIVHDKFVRKHKDVLSIQVPWFAPKVFGGLGFVEHEGCSAKLSYKDGVIIRAMANKVYTKETRPVPTKKEILLHKVAGRYTQHLPKVLTFGPRGEERGWNKLVSYALYLGGSDLIDQSPSELTQEIMHNNVDVWHYYYRHFGNISHYHPFEIIRNYRYEINGLLLEETMSRYLRG